MRRDKLHLIYGNYEGKSNERILADYFLLSEKSPFNALYAKVLQFKYWSFLPDCHQPLTASCEPLSWTVVQDSAAG